MAPSGKYDYSCYKFSALNPNTNHKLNPKPNLNLLTLNLTLKLTPTLLTLNPDSTNHKH